MKLIGISGTNGSGKDTLGEILVQDYGWFFVSVTELLRDELRRRGLPIIRENTRMISAEWRKQFGVGVLVDKALEEYKKQPNKYNGLVMASLRNPGEADELHRVEGILVWIDADPKVRYERIQAAKTKRDRSGEDDKTYEQFIKEEQDEMQYGGDQNSLFMAGVKTKADIFINNDSNDLDNFKQTIRKALDL